MCVIAAAAARPLLNALRMSRCTLLGLVLATSATVASAESLPDLTPTLPEQHEGIVGGSNAPAGKWPDTVAVIGPQGACTGTLIAPDIVLTAGHCAEIAPNAVVANTTDYEGAGGVRVGVTRTVAYPNWENSYDVAIVILSQPITGVTPRKVGTACTFNAFTANTMVHLVGFGATDMAGEAANTLLKEATTAVTDPTCATGSGCMAAVAPGGEFVAGGTGQADSCFGDSGGPVYLDTPRGMVVIGAVSRGVENSPTACGGGGIYVRTDKILQWIETTAGKAVMKDDCVTGPDTGGTGTGSGSGSGTGEDLEGGTNFGDVTGGCSASGTGSTSTVGFAFLALGMMLSRRRRGFSAKPAEAKPAEDPTPVRT